MNDPLNLAVKANTPPGVIRLVGVLLLEKPVVTVDQNGNQVVQQDNNVLRLYLTPNLTEWVDVARPQAVDSDRDGLGAGNDAVNLGSLAPTTLWVLGDAQLTYSRNETFTFGAEFLDGDILALLRRQRRLTAATTLGGVDELDVRDPLLDESNLPTSTRTGACG
jgi:hypothetical protein